MYTLYDYNNKIRYFKIQRTTKARMVNAIVLEDNEEMWINEFDLKENEKDLIVASLLKDYSDLPDELKQMFKYEFHKIY